MMRSYVRGGWFTFYPSLLQARRLAAREPSRESVAGSITSFPCGSLFRSLDISAEISRDPSDLHIATYVREFHTYRKVGG
jgi:hypothetical protein